VIALLAVAVWVAGAAAEQPPRDAGDVAVAGLSFRMGPGAVSAVDAHGATVWKLRTPEHKTPAITRTAGHMILLDNGYLIDARTGQLLARDPGDLVGGLGDGAGGESKETRKTRGDVYWDDYQDFGDSTLFNGDGVFFENNNGGDGLRRAWAVYGGWARQSEGHDAFGDPSAAPIGRIAIDRNDNITVMYRKIEEDPHAYSAYAKRYEPATGWSEEVLVYSTDAFWQSISLAADQDGNVIAMLWNDPDHAFLVCAVYDAGTGTWSESTVPLGGHPNTLTLAVDVVGNRSGTAVYLLYVKPIVSREASFVTYFGQPTDLWWAMFANRYDTATKQWSAPQMLPGSIGVRDDGGSARGCLAVVDEAGEATVVWAKRRALPDGHTVCGSRTEGGAWQAPTELSRIVTISSPDLTVWGDIDINDAGDVIAVFTVNNRLPGDANNYKYLHTVRYRAGVGWDATQYPVRNSMALVTRCRVCFYDGDKAVATTVTSVDGYARLVSLEYDGTSWSPDLLPLPEECVVYFQDLAGAQGTAVLMYENHEDWDYSPVRTTWLRETP
jgi:hypothetical protein